MSTATVNGVRLYYTLSGDAGPPLALVHGSWGDHTLWDPLIPALAGRFRVLAYDRRGHSQSEWPTGQGTAAEDAVHVKGRIVPFGVVCNSRLSLIIRHRVPRAASRPAPL